MFIMLNSAEKIQSFVNDMKKTKGEIDLISGRREVDGKSMLGVFSLDFTRPIEVRVQKADDTGTLEEILDRYSALETK